MVDVISLGHMLDTIDRLAPIKVLDYTIDVVGNLNPAVVLYSVENFFQFPTCAVGKIVSSLSGMFQKFLNN